MKKYQNAKTVLLILIISSFFSAMIWGILVWNNTRIKTLDTGTITEYKNGENGYIFHIDPEYDGERYYRDIEFSGWVIDTKASMERVTLDIVLKDLSSGAYYIVPTTMTERPEITEKYGNNEKTFTWSGFRVSIPQNKVINSNMSDYAVMALLSVNGDKKVLIDSGISLYEK